MNANRVHTVVYSVCALSLVALGAMLARSAADNKELKESLNASATRETDLHTKLENAERRVSDLEVERTRVIVVTEPDGKKTVTKETTKTTKTVSTDTASKQVADTKTKETSTLAESKTEKQSSRSVYSVTPEWSSVQAAPTGVSVGARLGALPLWAETGWDRNRGAHVGLRIEF